MEATTPKTAAKSGTLNLAKAPSAVPFESTQEPLGDTADRTGRDTTAAVESRLPQTSRFPTRARDEGRDGPTETKSEGFFSSQDWAESARNAVREHPFAVVGVALVAGLLVGRL